ncbi:MAG: hypothetical protein AAF696_00670 [Bacteroidota bacterium]
MEALKLLLNFSFMLAFLVAPFFILMAFWYRKRLSNTIMLWRKPEMVIITIVFSVASLILFLVGISSIFTYFDLNFFDNVYNPVEDREKFKKVGLICGLLLLALLATYASIRMLLVRVITEKGIVKNDRFFRIPDFKNIIPWENICDYYLVSDYPNVIFTLIIHESAMKYSRISIPVPVYVREEFEELLESKMNSNSNLSEEADISPHRFSEN